MCMSLQFTPNSLNYPLPPPNPIISMFSLQHTHSLPQSSHPLVAKPATPYWWTPHHLIYTHSLPQSSHPLVAKPATSYWWTPHYLIHTHSLPQSSHPLVAKLATSYWWTPHYLIHTYPLPQSSHPLVAKLATSYWWTPHHLIHTNSLPQSSQPLVAKQATSYWWTPHYLIHTHPLPQSSHQLVTKPATSYWWTPHHLIHTHSLPQLSHHLLPSQLHLTDGHPIIWSKPTPCPNHLTNLSPSQLHLTGTPFSGHTSCSNYWPQLFFYFCHSQSHPSLKNWLMVSGRCMQAWLAFLSSLPPTITSQPWNLTDICWILGSAHKKKMEEKNLKQSWLLVFWIKNEEKEEEKKEKLFSHTHQPHANIPAGRTWTKWQDDELFVSLIVCLCRITICHMKKRSTLKIWMLFCVV